MKTHGISRTQCWTLFVISKATFTKTAIKLKFVDRFSLKNFRAAIDQCTIKSLNVVSIENHENFLSCLTSAQNWLHIEAMSWIWLRFCSGTSYCLELSTALNTHALSTREFTALACPPLSIRYCFLPFDSSTIFPKDFRGQPGTVNSRLLHGNFPLSRDIYSDRAKNNIIIKLSLCVIRVL